MRQQIKEAAKVVEAVMAAEVVNAIEAAETIEASLTFEFNAHTFYWLTLGQFGLQSGTSSLLTSVV